MALKKFAGLGTALAVAALLWGSVAASVSAQTPPYSAYGTGATAGDEIAAWIDGVVCGETTVDAAGEWVIFVEAGGDCGAADGDTIMFSVNGEVAEETATWSAGGVPDDVAAGIMLTIADAGTTDPAPDPADTGNAGLMGSAGTSMALVLALGVFAAALVAGGRTAVRRS